MASDSEVLILILVAANYTSVFAATNTLVFVAANTLVFVAI